MSYNYKGISNTPKIRSDVIYPWCYWDNAFSQEELNELTQYLSNQELQKGFIGVTSDTGEKDSALDLSIRNSEVCFIRPNETIDWVFKKFNYVIESMNNSYFNFDLNGYEAFQYTEYNENENGKYDFHIDMSLTQLNTNEHRKLSVVLFLSDPSEYEGGNFEIQTSPNVEVVEQIKGRIILFPSFVLHRVTPVTKGVRKSIVLWVEGPKFK